MDINGNTHNNRLTLGSLFSGSGGFELAGIMSEITPVFNSEIEPFAIRVTTKRLPQVKHYGDVSALKGAELPPVDIITFGSPCQDMSIAGKRSGLDGSRSSLFYEAIRIVKEMRCATNGEKPRFIIWENVPGAFSSNKGADFKAVLESVIGVAEPSAEVPAPDQKGWPDADYYLGDGWSVAYRVLDAQGWGVPQRRKRIYLVADFAGQSAPKVLFESEGVSGYSAAGFRAWQRAASGAESGAGTAGGSGRTVRSGGAVRSGGGIVLNDQGGACMDVSEDVTGTLRAQEHGHPPCVMEAAGFCTEHSANARSIGYEEERSPTLRAGVVPAAIALENHPMDSRVKIAEDGKVQTLPTRMGTGGGNVPLLMEPEVEEPGTPVTLKIRSGCDGGGKGAIWQEDKSATLGCNNDQTLFVPEPKAHLEPKAYGICSKASHAMLSDNPHSGFYEADTSRTLDQNGGRPDCAQGGVAICQPVAFTQNQRDEVRDLGDKAGALAAEPGAKQQTYVAQAEPTAFHVNQRNELIDLHGKSGALMATRSDQMQTFVLQGSMIGRSEENGPQGDGINEDVSFTLDATDRHAVCTPDTPDDGVYAMTTGSYMQVEKDVSPTLMARDFKDPTSIAPVPQEVSYTVRRLTPTECARLQGFPDDWCHDLGTADPTDEEIAFWTDVFETHRRLVTHAKKPKTEKQIRKWLADPYSDAAEYKLWGNGISLPIPYFVLSGIVWACDKDFSQKLSQ